MATMTVTTGFGYLKDSGGIVTAKCELPAGDHEIKEGYTYVEVADKTALDAVFVGYSEGTVAGTVEAAQAKTLLKGQAQAALDKSDITLLRCVENGVAIPAEWVTYRAALRPIAKGESQATELPEQPSYPEGT